MPIQAVGGLAPGAGSLTATIIGASTLIQMGTLVPVEPCIMPIQGLCLSFKSGLYRAFH